MSLAHLLNDGPATKGQEFSYPSGPLSEPTPPIEAKPKRKRPARAGAGPPPHHDDDAQGSGRRSSRQSARPKRYSEQPDEDQDDNHSEQTHSNLVQPKPSPTRLSRVGQADPNPNLDDDADELLRATTNIWQRPLDDYIASLAQKRRQVEHDFFAHEHARAFQTAARVEDATERRLVAMRERKQVRLQEQQIEAQAHARQAQELERQAQLELQKQANKDLDREARLKKQREAAKRRRHEEKRRQNPNWVPRQTKANRAASIDHDDDDLHSIGNGYSYPASEVDELEDDLGLSEPVSRHSAFSPFPSGQHGALDSAHLNSAAYHSSPYPQSDGPEFDRGSSLPPDLDDGHQPEPTGQAAATDGPGPKRKARSVDDLERRVWTHIARREIPKVNRIVTASTSGRQFFTKRLSAVVAREARRAQVRTKGAKDVQMRAKKVMREMFVFMKGNEKREREARKRAEKEALEKTKKEEEVREAKRQARKLNFLITQTELYSHFIGDKIKTNEAEDSADTAGDEAPVAPQPSAAVLAAIAAGEAPPGAQLKELDFEEDDETNMALHARRGAQAAMDAAKNAANAFDQAANVGAAAVKPVDIDSPELNFNNPTMGDIQVKQPKILSCTLKEYQLKGLNWLANLYEQGINGILADEMGLGKTVQSISLMAYLAEVHNIWGPFLVIAPASTLHNWQQEIAKFVPSLKALPYWGSTKDRAVLRKFWNRKSLKYDKDAPFHILVTSYQLVVQDEKYFNQVKWQYMVLDEAQAIKSSSSTRWKTLLGFRCRNRLLLTGTPIQNSMHELWALLHFIMPSLFDSHDEFSEWFSKDIEGNVEKGAMNEHQLRRLHMILKPFMLRRIKKNVQNELGDKIEIDLYCDLTPRQKAMYRTLRENISITDLVSRASSLTDDDSVKRLMNLIMQFRKVCNHPELFERADVTAPLSFAAFNATASLTRDPDVLEVPYTTSSVIEYAVPKALYRGGGIKAVPGPSSRAGSDSLHLDRLFNIWTPEHIHNSLKAQDSAFAFSRALKLSPAELNQSVQGHGIIRLGLALEREQQTQLRHDYDKVSDHAGPFAITATVQPKKSKVLPFDPRWRSLGLTPLHQVEQSYRLASRLGQPDTRFYMDKVVAPTIQAVSTDRSFMYDQQNERFDPLFSAAFFGVANENSRADVGRFQKALPGFSPAGIVPSSSAAQLPFPPMQVPQLQKLILDSGKLAKLDALLTELKAGGHRVLVYFQMTRMIDLMEEYLAFRQYKYLRLDGSSTISERRDMVTDWQTKEEIFIFLLSTRAGGLGINLTAADTVIFYDSDWNPSNDAQAMDRAHRLGQTRQVTVYRLITKDTVDERILQMARHKKLVQDAVVGSSNMAPTEQQTRTNEVVSLLLTDEELQAGLDQAEARRKAAEEKMAENGRRGASSREERKKVRAEELADEERRRADKLGGKGWAAGVAGDEDEDGFGFFANATSKGGLGDDDDMEQASGAATPTAGGVAAEGGLKRKAEGDAGGEEKRQKNGARRRRTKAEMEAARAEEAERKADKKRAKEAARSGGRR